MKGSSRFSGMLYSRNYQAVTTRFIQDAQTDFYKNVLIRNFSDLQDAFEVAYVWYKLCRYTTAGRDILGQIQTGDIIKSAKLIEGQDRLILPAQNNSSST